MQNIVFFHSFLVFKSEEEPVSKDVEKFLQYSCYIDKDVKYLHTGLKNRLSESLNYVSAP